MSEHKNRPRMRDTVLLTGWLFADLLLALFVIFLAANTSGIKAIRPTPTPTPTFALMTPTPTQLPHLSLKPQTLSLIVDSQGLLKGTPSAINDFKNQIRHMVNPFKNRRAGFVLVFVGAPDPTNVNPSLQAGSKIESILQTFDSESLVFRRSPNTVYYDPLINLYDAFKHVLLQVYLFDQ